MKRIPLDTQDVIHRLRDEGQTVRAIAKRCRVTRHAVCRCLEAKRAYDLEESGTPYYTPTNPHQGPPPYLPTQEAIAAECARIRAGWTEEERLRRDGIRPADLRMV